MNRLSCAQAFERLDDYVDRELAPADVAAVEAHLETCARCAGEFTLEREVLESLRTKLRRIAAPRDLLARISARLRQEG